MSALAQKSSDDQVTAMFSSRQKALAGNSELDNAFAELPNTAITKILYAKIPRLQETFRDMKSRVNTFCRTRVGFMADEAESGTGLDSTRFVKASTPQASTGHAADNETKSPSSGALLNASNTNNVQRVSYARYVSDDEIVLFDSVVRASAKNASNLKIKGFVRSGPRRKIVWGEGEVRAAIAVCGGLCPGLNDCIEELFNALYYNYGVDVIYGVRNGFAGFWQQTYQPWERLTPAKVRGISGQGGCVLGTGVGGFDAEKVLNACEVYGINQLFLIGGDGTHICAKALLRSIANRNMKMAVAVIPKSIDNDLGLIDGSFGFNTAVAEAVKAIESVRVESMCAPNGIGIVTLMGRSAGYIASHAVLASREVDLCLIPEVPFQLEGPKGVCAYLKSVLQRQGYAVIVVAEGAGGPLVESLVCKELDTLKKQAQARLEASGGAVAQAEAPKAVPTAAASPVADAQQEITRAVVEHARVRAAADSNFQIENILKRELAAYFKKEKIATNIRCVDPGVMVRSVAPSAADAVMTLSLCHNAVHGTMAGYTGFSSAIVNNRSVMIPVGIIAASSPSFLSPTGRTWERVLSLTQQPTWPSYDATVIKILDDHAEFISKLRKAQRERQSFSDDTTDTVVDAVTSYRTPDYSGQVKSML